MRRALALIFLLALAPSAAVAQEWSSEQQEVLDAVIGCWDLWMDGVEQGTPDPWLDSCETEDATFWAGADGAPMLMSAEFLRRNWGADTGIDLAWVDLRPIYIGIRGDAAVLHFYGYWRLPGPDGPQVEEWKRTEVWRMDRGRWRQWVGHATPVERQ